MAEVTKILYDVSQAVDKLKKLDSETKKSGKEQQKAFKKLGGDIDIFGDKIGNIDPKIGNLVKGFGSIARVAGPAGLAVGAVGAAAAGLAASIIDVPQLLRDATAELQRFIDVRERARRGRDARVDLASSRNFTELTNADLELRARRSQITQRQVQVAADIEVARNRVNTAKESFRAIEDALRDSVQRQKDLQSELGDTRADSIVGEETRGKAAGRGTVDLIARAEQEALQGNTELAKELLDEAKDRTKELGNHVFFTSKIEDVESQIRNQLEEQVEEEKKIQAELKKRISLQKQLVQREEGGLQALQTEQGQLTRDKANLESIANDINRAKELDTASTQATKGLNDMEAAARIAADTLKRITAPTAGETGTATLDRLQALAPGGRTQRDVLDNSRVVRQLATEATRAVQIITQSTDPRQVDQAADFLERLADRTDRLRDTQPGRVLSTQNEINLQRVEQVIEQGFRAVTARSNINLAGRGATGSPTGVESQIVERASQALGTALARELPQAPGGGARQSNITVNANVKGGLIDADTTRTITDIIRKEIRKQTTEANIN